MIVRTVDFQNFLHVVHDGSAAGQKLLAGESNNVLENGIDDWIGGVHLNDNEPVTFRNGGVLTLH
jgi:hypothetical protein